MAEIMAEPQEAKPAIIIDRIGDKSTKGTSWNHLPTETKQGILLRALTEG